MGPVSYIQGINKFSSIFQEKDEEKLHRYSSSCDVLLFFKSHPIKQQYEKDRAK